ncbi:hypothetical protein MMYC01_206298 [Madurella mycetomatis]|uniref:SGNH hydrolase-type esterase domain-containing protein n=1 Tax=Madurella mycetomatis TaxID=100816 RepID=A0A175VZD1_9PEZI|nr:hypothetical protein MMYC01_206298 [Madurella mycetomatis]
MTARPKLRILCLGDSLTAGYSAMGAIHHPYSAKLEQMVAMAFPHLDIETVEDGLPGAPASIAFLNRMQNHFGPRNPNRSEDGKYYDWAIVLGGTNDVGMGLPPEEVFEKLKMIWNIPLRNGCKVLALTVPEAALSGAIRERIDARRNRLNDLIKGYRMDGFHVFDLNKAVTYYSMSDTDKERYWDDHLHFTPDGYDLIGNKVGIALVSIMAREKTNELSPAKRRRMFKDDNTLFEEEAGDPKAIDQGYIVVRRADLD